MPIEDFLRDGNAASWHPLLRYVNERLAAGESATFELEQPPDGFGIRQAKISLRLWRDSQELDCKVDDWDDDLNTGLIALGIRSASIEAEKDRFAWGLRAALRKPESRFGDGYFNSMLIKFVSESDFRNHPDVSAVLNHISYNPPFEGQAYQECLEMIQEAIRGRGLELTRSLNYPLDEAGEILAGALAHYLDERFSVSRRRMLGLID